MKNLVDSTTGWTDVTPKFSYRWMCGDTIFHVRLTGADQKSIDAWAEQSLSARLTCKQDEPLLILSDHRQSTTIVTPYFLRALPALYMTRPELRTYMAFILDDSEGAQSLRASFRMLYAQSTLKMCLFEQPDEAVEWLLAQSNAG